MTTDKVNIVCDSTDKHSASTLIEFRNQYYRIFTPYYPDGTPMKNIVNKANHEGFVSVRSSQENLIQNSHRTHSDAIVAFEKLLILQEEARRAKVNNRNRERYDAMRMLGMKRTPYGWE